MFGVLSVTITIRFELKQNSCNCVWQSYFGLKEKENNSLTSDVVHLTLQFSDNVRTFFSVCNTEKPLDLVTNTVTMWSNLVLEAVAWCLEGTTQVSVFLKNAPFLLYSKRILKASFVSIWVLPVSWKTRVMVDQHVLSKRQTIITQTWHKIDFSHWNFLEFVKKLAWFQKIIAPEPPFYLITVLNNSIIHFACHNGKNCWLVNLNNITSRDAIVKTTS